MGFPHIAHGEIALQHPVRHGKRILFVYIISYKQDFQSGYGDEDSVQDSKKA